MRFVKVKNYVRENWVGMIGLCLACIAVASLRVPPVLAMEVAIGTTILIATLLAIVLCLLSLARDRNKLPGFLGILVVLLGETYKLPLILINAFTLLVVYLPFLLGALLVGVLVRYLYRRSKLPAKR